MWLSSCRLVTQITVVFTLMVCLGFFSSFFCTAVWLLSFYSSAWIPVVNAHRNCYLLSGLGLGACVFGWSLLGTVPVSCVKIVHVHFR